MLRKFWKRVILGVSILALALPSLTLSEFPMAAAASESALKSDLEGHWSEEVFSKWIEQGWINGYTDGTFKPDKPVKRAELAAMINRAFGLAEPSDTLPFTDINSTHWAYKDILIAFQAGYLKGANGKANADTVATRQEGAVMMANVLKLESVTSADLSQYKDGNSAAVWAQSALSQLSAKGIFKGDTNGNLRPGDVLTRAQAITVIDSALVKNQEKVVFDTAGEYGSLEQTQVIKGDVVVTAAGVTLINMEIQGDLLLAEGIAEGDVYLKKVNVRGTMTVQGGGENSIHVEDTVLVKVIVDKATGKVRIVATGSTDVKTVVVQSPVKLEEQDFQSGKGFNAVELSKSLPANSKIDLVGQFEDVRVLATTIQINIPSGTIEHLDVAANSNDNKIELGEDASIVNLVLNAIAELAGKGQIMTATLSEQAEGTKFETEPVKVEGPGQSGGATTPPVVIPGGGGGGPVVQPPAGNQSNAALSDVQVGGNYSLVQRDAQLAAIGTGFHKNILGYSISVPRNISNITVPVTVTSESDEAKIYATVEYKDQTSANFSLTNTNRAFNVQLKPLEDVQVSISVISGNGLIEKNYWISFQYERTVQDAFLIRQYDLPYLIEPGNVRYEIYSSKVFNKNDVAELYESSDATEPFLSAVAGNLGEIYLMLNGENARLQETGEFFIKVKRGGQDILVGDFKYDFSTIPRITDVEGVTVRSMTNVEREETLGDLSPKVPYYRVIALDPSRWSGTLLEDAKYYTNHEAPSDSIYFELGAPVRDSYKADLDPFYTNINLIRQAEGYYGMHNMNDPIVYDSYVQIIFYNKNYQPIGYYQEAMEPGPEHVLPGYTVVHSIRPELNTGDQTPPAFTGALPAHLAVGEKLFFSVNEKANVYIVPDGTQWETGKDIDSLVRSGGGAGARYEITDISAALDTSKLATGDWIVVAIDASGNISSSVLISLVDPESVIMFDGFMYNFNKGIGLRFDTEIGVPDNLKEAISLSRDGGLTYEPLGQGDRVSRDTDNSIYIVFEHPYSGSLNQIKINKGTLVHVASGRTMDYDWISPTFEAGTDVAMTSETNLEIGEEVVFSVDRAATLYLVPLDWFGRFQEAVAEGKGKSVTLNEQQAGQEIRISTQGLVPGKYVLYTQLGVIHTINLNQTQNVESNQITVVNSQIEKSVTVTNLNPGDTIRVYGMGMMNSERLLLQSKTVLSGETSVKLEVPGLSDYGSVLITIQAPDRGESKGLGINY
ncbi:S-layer homology domain-containing protein [Paenibacillus sp. strain BS8-2]